MLSMARPVSLLNVAEAHAVGLQAKRSDDQMVGPGLGNSTSPGQTTHNAPILAQQRAKSQLASEPASERTVPDAAPATTEDEPPKLVYLKTGSHGRESIRGATAFKRARAAQRDTRRRAGSRRRAQATQQSSMNKAAENRSSLDDLVGGGVVVAEGEHLSGNTTDKPAQG